MKKLKLILIVFLIGVSTVMGQVAINTDGSAPDNSAILDVKSTTKGVLLPRLTNAERDLISSPATGLIIYNSDAQALQVYGGSYWMSVTTASCSPSQPGSITGNTNPNQNSTGETYSIDAVSDASSYNWTVPSGASITSGQGTTSINVNFGVTNGNISVRAENGCGESSYTDLAIILFSCGSQLTDSRDSKVYNTVLIGSQCWMAENLNVGAAIGSNTSQTDNGTIEKYCYNNSSSNCDTYGGLYQWHEMMQYVTTEGAQGICLDGWHLPTDTEWKTMEMQLGMSQSQADAMGWRGTDEGGKLKEIGTTHWTSPNTGATNSSGFTCLPGGYYNDYSFSFLTTNAYFYSSSRNSTIPWYRSIKYNSSQIARETVGSMGFSVRCVMD